MPARSIASEEFASSCYFRTTVEAPFRKALVQIDERCNLRCAHCFVNAVRTGRYMSLPSVAEHVVPRLREARVRRVTLTGGEPTMHPDFFDVVRAFRDAGMDVGVCTNATLLDPAGIEQLGEIGGVHCNVSLDGFHANSHGRFRGDRASFAVTVETVRALARAGLLQGLLCTPNSLAEVNEYRDLCAFATELGAGYVLMNPLSNMGRGVKAQRALRSPAHQMREISELTAPFDGPDLDVTHIRFPNDEAKPLAGCEAGTIIYVFTPGEVTVCPYLVFAARTPISQHDPDEFIVGNIFTDDIADRLDNYRLHDRYQVGENPTCRSCSLDGVCGKGCPAAVVATGGRIGDLDAEQCPVATAPDGRRLLPVVTR